MLKKVTTYNKFIPIIIITIANVIKEWLFICCQALPAINCHECSALEIQML